MVIACRDPHNDAAKIFTGDSAYDFLGMIIDSAGGSASDRMAFKVYALQRLHAANFRGVAAVINSRPVIRTGPGVPPGFGLQPLGTARPILIRERERKREGSGYS